VSQSSEALAKIASLAKATAPWLWGGFIEQISTKTATHHCSQLLKNSHILFSLSMFVSTVNTSRVCQTKWPKVADTLSRRFDLTDIELTNLIHSSFPSQVTKFFPNLPSPSRGDLMGDLLAAAMQREDGVTQNTKDKELRVWKRWAEYTTAIGFSQYVWLTNLLPEH
jgi:hypothetical protein